MESEAIDSTSTPPMFAANSNGSSANSGSAPADDRDAGADSHAIVVDGLSRRFGDIEAVRGVSFKVETGETFGFLGPNGAGKSTTISMLCTLLRPTSGSALVAGADVVSEQGLVRSRIGLVFQDPTVDDQLTAEENLRFHAQLYGVPKVHLASRLRQVLEMVDLWDRRASLVRTFSGGMRRRLEIARGLLHSPRVLFLDEPTVGLDPQTRAHIWEYINLLRKTERTTIFVTTHYMDEAEHCDRIAIIDGGKIVALDTPEALKEGVGKDRIEITSSDTDRVISQLKQQFDLEATVSEGAVTFFVASGEEFVPRLFHEVDVPIQSIRVARPTIDDVFMSYTGRTIRDAEGSGSNAAAGAWMRARR